MAVNHTLADAFSFAVSGKTPPGTFRLSSLKKKLAVFDFFHSMKRKKGKCELKVTIEDHYAKQKTQFSLNISLLGRSFMIGDLKFFHDAEFTIPLNPLRM
jgi:hypothetical protein